MRSFINVQSCSKSKETFWLHKQIDPSKLGVLSKIDKKRFVIISNIILLLLI